MQTLKDRLENNKTIGYSAYEKQGEINNYVMYALKKDKATSLYCTFYFKIAESKMAIPEDCAPEESRQFFSYEDAIKYLLQKNCSLERLDRMKGSGPPI